MDFKIFSFPAKLIFIETPGYMIEVKKSLNLKKSKSK